MIINVRGANGSGKTTVARRILELHEAEPVYMNGRKRPISYVCKKHDRPLAFIGSYENPTGGADTITGGIEMIFELVKTYQAQDHDVLFEGIVAQHSATRLLEVNALCPVDVVVLATSQDDCVASVRQRRAARGATVEEFDPKNVIKEWKSVQSSTRRLRGDGVRIHELDREAAFLWIKERLPCAA